LLYHLVFARISTTWCESPRNRSGRLAPVGNFVIVLLLLHQEPAQ